MKGSNFYVINLSVCEFQNYDILYVDFLKCRFKNCTFHKGLWRKSNFDTCVFENCTFVGIEFNRVEFLSTNFINLKFDSKNSTLISNSKTSIEVRNLESFQEAIIVS